MALMFFGSTDLMSADHTSRFITPFLRWLDPQISWQTIGQVHFLVRKAAHVTEYAILTGLLFRALRWSISGLWRRGFVALIPALLYAPLDEFHQSFVPSRTSSIRDVSIDYCGAILGILLARLLHLSFCKLKREQAPAGRPEVRSMP